MPLRKFTALGALILAWLMLAPLRADADSRLHAARDLAAESAASASEGRVLLVLFSQQGCPWCERVRREFLLPIQKNEDYTSRVAFRQIDVDRKTPLRGFRGEATTHAEFARAYGVRLYPTEMLFGAGGESLAEPIVGFTGSDFYGAFLDRRIDEAVARLRAK